MRREVGGGREARQRLGAERRLDRGLRLRVLAEPGAEPLEVGLAGLGVGAPQPDQLQEVLGRAGDERGRRRRQDVRLLARAAQLDGHAAGLALGVVGLGLAARVREPDQGGDRLALQMKGARELGRARGGRERPLAPGALRVQGAAALVGAVEAVGGGDDLLVEIPRGHRRPPYRQRMAIAWRAHGPGDRRTGRARAGRKPRHRQGNRDRAGARGSSGGDREPHARDPRGRRHRDRGRRDGLRRRHGGPRADRAPAGRGRRGPRRRSRS